MIPERKPTEAELAILRVLWARGPSTVREVATAMGREGAYTTVLKLMQIMAAKGLVARDDAERAHVYRATHTEDQTQRHLVKDLLDRVFDGSASTLVMQALASSPASDEEMRAIRRVLDRARREALRAPAGKSGEEAMTNAAWMEGAVRAIGWTLVSSMWQGVLIVGVVTVVLRALRSASAEARYVVACVGLLLMAFGWVGTALYLGRGLTTGGPSAGPAPVAVRGVPELGPAGPFDTTPAVRILRVSRTVRDDASALRWQQRLDRLVPWLVPVWLVGVGVLSVRLGLGWWGTRRLRAMERAAVTPGLQDQVARLSSLLGIRRVVHVVRSSRVDVPATIGWLRPLVLVPASAFAGLTPAQLEAVLVHELAHVRRHDYAVNVLQSAIEIVLFYHPACWWLSRRIRTEREHCCDDVAVAVCGDGLAYAAALADLEARRVRPLLAVAATDGPLLERIRRILAGHAPRPRTTGLAAALIPTTVLVLTLAMMPATGVARLSALVQSAVPMAGRTLPPDEGILQGRIVEAGSARPVRQATIEVVRQGGGVGHARAGDDGRYEVRGLRPGYYTLTVRAQGYVEGHYGTGERAAMDPGAAVDVRGGRVTSGIDVSLQVAGSVSGRIWGADGEALGGVEVELLGTRLLAEGARSVPVAFAQTVEDGSYRVVNVRPGDYFVRAYASSDTRTKDVGSERTYAPTMYPGVTDQMVAQRLRVYAGQDLFDVDFGLEITKLLRVSGTVVDPSEPLRPDVRVMMLPMGPSGGGVRVEPLKSEVDKEGRFLIEGVRPGEYMFGVADDRMTSRWVSAMKPIVVDEDLTGVELRAALGAAVEGRVVRDPNASASLDLTAVRVGYEKWMAGGNFSGGGRDVAADGTFAFEVPGGPIAVTVRTPRGWMVSSISVDGADIGDEPVDLGSGRRRVDVVVTDKGSVVGGLVVDRKGQPLVNYSVVLFSPNRAQWHEESRHVFAVRSRADGRFEVEAMPPGEYLAVAVPALPMSVRHNVDVLTRLESQADRLRVSEGQRLLISIRASPMPEGLVQEPRSWGLTF